MTAFPKCIRMAQQGDEDRLFAIFAVAHAENGYGDMDPERVRDAIAKGCVGDGNVIALVDGPERIEAVIALTPERRWYSTDKPSNYYSTEMLIYVHPLHRRTRHAARLFRFAQWWEQETKLPVVLNLMPKEDFPGKERLFARFGRRVGASFMIGGTDSWPSQVGTA
jgi:GNAT superfamily N-acetyltransferase